MVALITLAPKEGLYRYMIRRRAAQRSALLSASAWHHRSDAFSAISVAVSIAGVPFLETVAVIGGSRGHLFALIQWARVAVAPEPGDPGDPGGRIALAKCSFSAGGAVLRPAMVQRRASAKKRY